MEAYLLKMELNLKILRRSIEIENHQKKELCVRLYGLILKKQMEELPAKEALGFNLGQMSQLVF